MKRRLVCIILAISALTFIGCSKEEQPAPAAEQVQQRETGLVDLTVLDDAARKAKISDMMADPDRYEGVVVKVTGKAKKYRDSGLNEDFYMVLTTWEGDTEGFCYTLADNRYPKTGSMVTLTGILSNYTREVDGESVTYTELKESKVLEELPETTPTIAPTATPSPTPAPETVELKETSFDEDASEKNGKD